VFRSGPVTVADRPNPPSLSLGIQAPSGLELPEFRRAESHAAAKPGSPHRMGVHRELPANARDQGVWSALPDGRHVWQLAIHSGGAAAMRVQFGDFAVGVGNVWVHTGNPQGQTDGPYTGEGPYNNGEFWSGTIAGERIVIEYEPAAGVAAEGRPPFRIRTIAHHTETVAERIGAGGNSRLAEPLALSATLAMTPAPVDLAASCTLDVNCYPEWSAIESSIAYLVFEETEGPEVGTFLCSGSLVATRDNSFKPYLLTAAHCIHDEPAARSLETAFAYESSACSAGAPSSYGTLNAPSGGHLLQSGTFEQGDFSLVLLPGVPNGVMFNGWDVTDPALSVNVVDVSHPMGSYKRIAFGETVQSNDAEIGTDFLPADLYTTVQFFRGITQPGSSGSPLFTAPGVVVGTLTYGPDLPADILCNGNDISGFGKFSNAYGYLSSYLEDLPSAVVKPSTNSLSFTGLNGKIAGGPQNVQLTTGAQSPVQFKIRPDASWLKVTASAPAVSASAPVSLQVQVDPKYLKLTNTYSSTVTILSGAAPPQYIEVKLGYTFQVSNVTVTATPNPVSSVSSSSGPEWNFQLALKEGNGVATTITELKINAVDYSGQIASWFGTNKIAAGGTVEGRLTITALPVPTTEYFELYGKDVASGKTWYRVLSVNFQ
jgi:hypothetical protein